MNHSSFPYPDSIEPDDFATLPAGELPDVEQLPPDEPSGPPAATNDPFGQSMVINGAVQPAPASKSTTRGKA